MILYDATSGYREVLQDILTYGGDASPRGMAIKEIVGYSFQLLHPRFNLIDSPVRRLNYTFSVAEFLWILAGRSDVEFLTRFNPRMLEFSDDSHKLAGAYGPKFVRQLPYVILTLQRDPESRRAVINIWRDNPAPSKDIPCTLSLQFILRDGLLQLITTMRSNDAWLGLPYDLYTFTQLQRVVATLLGAELGPYTHQVGSMHLYQEHLTRAERVIVETTLPPTPVPLLTAPPATLNTALDGVGGKFFALEEYTCWPAEWYQLLAVLAYRFHKDKSRLAPPWCDLV